MQTLFARQWQTYTLDITWCDDRIQYVRGDHRSEYGEVVSVLVLREQLAQLLGTVDALRKPQVAHILPKYMYTCNAHNR